MVIFRWAGVQRVSTCVTARAAGTQDAPTRSTRQRRCGVGGVTGSGMAAGSAGGAAARGPASEASLRKRFSPTCCCCRGGGATVASGAAKSTTGTHTVKHAPRPGAVSTLMLPPIAARVHRRVPSAPTRTDIPLRPSLTFCKPLADVEACQIMRA
jgi:hypothetical protein